MVKQSRRQVKKRSLRRRTAKKRVMKGGIYSAPSQENNEVSFIRRMPKIAGGIDLYKLTSKFNDDGSITHILDFSHYKGNFVISKFITADRYKEILKKDLIVRDTSQQEAIDRLIDQLFDGGIPGIMKRKLVITEFLVPATKIHILENNEPKGNEISIDTGKRFVDYLLSKNDEVEVRSGVSSDYQVQSQPQSKPGIFSMFRKK